MGPSADLDFMKEKKNILPLPGIENLLLDRPARNLVAKPIELSRFINMITGYIIMRQFFETHCSKYELFSIGF
jgi:hypothetical protein